MGLDSLRVGDKLQTADGSTVEVIGPPTPKSVWTRVLDAPFGPDGPGTEKMLDSDDIYGVYTDDTLTAVRAL